MISEPCEHLPMSLLYAVVLSFKCPCVMLMSSPVTAEQIYLRL